MPHNPRLRILPTSQINPNGRCPSGTAEVFVCERNLELHLICRSRQCERLFTAGRYGYSRWHANKRRPILERQIHRRTVTQIIDHQLERHCLSTGIGAEAIDRLGVNHGSVRCKAGLP